MNEQNKKQPKRNPGVIAAIGIGIVFLVVILWMAIPSKLTVDKKPQLPAASGAVASSNSLSAKADTGAASKSGMVWIPGGSFGMGSPEGEGAADEHPQHTVIVKGFYLDKTEVTQTEYEHVMGQNPSYFKDCPNCPVENVSWEGANEYCKKVGKRLPTEAEWEYAAKGGTQTKYYWGNEFDSNYAWYDKNSTHKTHPIAQKMANPFGLADMSGNVWEWCADWYDATYYRKNIADNPHGPDTGESRVLRGGSWGYGSYSLRCACRNWGNPSARTSYAGFRCAR